MHATERPQQRAPRLHLHSSYTGLPARHHIVVACPRILTVSLRARGSWSSAPSPNSLKDNDRDLARGLLLVLREKRHQRGLRGEEPTQVM